MDSSQTLPKSKGGNTSDQYYNMKKPENMLNELTVTKTTYYMIPFIGIRSVQNWQI